MSDKPLGELPRVWAALMEMRMGGVITWGQEVITALRPVTEKAQHT
jgi:hypothetical protein